MKPRRNQDIRVIAARSSATIVGELPESGAYLLRYRDLPSAQTALGRIRADGVGYAEPNTVLSVAQDDYPVAEQDDYPVAEQDDYPISEQDDYPVSEQDDYPVAEGAVARALTLASNKWRSQPAYQQIGVAAANRKATGRGETVAVLDTAVRMAHPVFGWMWKTGNDGKRFAGGGWAKPIDLIGGKVGPDEGAHGTFVAGTVAGVAPGARILPVRVANAQGEASAFTLAQGILAATARGVDVINISLGTSVATPRVLQDAIEYAQKKHILVVTSAGNENSGAPHYPSVFAFSVGSVDSRDRRASFSNFGNTVDTAAPGVSVYGPLVWGGKARMAGWSGTSFSAGITSGVAALVAQSENAQGDRIERIIEKTAKDLAGSTGLSGRVDAAAAVGAR